METALRKQENVNAILGTRELRAVRSAAISMANASRDVVNVRPAGVEKLALIAC